MAWGFEQYFLFFVHLAGIAGFIMFPRQRRREAYTIFLFQGMLTWVLGLLVVEAGLLVYPVRELARASSTSFVFEFLIYPVVAAYYNIFYPGRGSSKPVKVGWLLLFAAGITVPEYLIEKYTDLLEYTGWHWYWTFLSIAATLYVSRLFYVWFFSRNITKTPRITP